MSKVIMRILGFVLLMFLTVTTNISFAQILTYGSATSGALSSVASGASGTALARVNGAGSPGSPCGSGFTSDNFTTTTTYSTSLAAIEITVTPASGYTLNVTGFTADLRRSNTGPASTRFAYSITGGSTWVDPGTDFSPRNASCGTVVTANWSTSFSTTSTLTFRIYGFNASATGGHLQILNLSINGTTTCSAPVVGAITGVSNVCAGSAITFSDTSTTGTWGITNTSVATINTTGIVRGLTPGLDTVTYSVTNSCGTTVVMDTVRVNTQPTASWTTALSTICTDSLTTFVVTGTPGSVFTTSTNGTPGLSHRIYPSGTFTINVTGFNGGTTPVNFTYVLVGDTLGQCYQAENDTIILTVEPYVSAISGPSTVCLGASASYSDTLTGGTWSVSNTSIATIGTGTGILTSLAAGTDTITYISPRGCTRTKIITVSGSLPAIAGSTQVCVGSKDTLTNSVTGGTWASSNAAVATITSATGIVTGLSVGTTVITYTASGGCTVLDTITVNPLPTPLIGPDTICVGSTYYYSTTGGSGTWNNTGSSLSYDPFSGGIDAIAAGNDTLIFIIMATGCSTSLPILVNNPPSVITGPTSVCESGGVINLSDATPGGTWSSSNTTTATVNTSGQVTGVTAGSADISYTIASTTCSAIATITVNPLPPAISGPASVCVGSSVTLTNTLAGGTWSSSNTGIATISTSGILTGVAVGSVTITYTSTAGCQVTTNITVNAPTGATTGPSSVCEGSTITLTNSISGGSWTSSNTSIASVNPTTGDVTGVSSGTVTITYGAGTSCDAYTTITVNPLPSAISGAATICFSSTTTYTDATSSGTWATSDGSIASISTGGTVTGVAVGAAVITYTLPTGCFITSGITIDGLPATIGGSASVCVGATASVTDASTGGTWATSNAGIASVNASTGLVTGVSANTCTITYTLPGGCYTTSSFTVNPLPAAITAPTTSVCGNGVVTLSDATATGTWSSSNTGIATVNPSTGDVTGVTPGSVVIYYTLPTTCSASFGFTVEPVPAAITGATSVCLGSTTTLNDASATGTWTTSNAAIASVNLSSGLVTGVASGSCTITYTLGGGCYVTSPMTVNSLPSGITGPVSVCEFSSVTLSDPSPTGTWSSSNTAIATVNPSTGAVTGVSVGSVVISYTLPTTCSSSVTFSVMLQPAAITGASVVCMGSTTTLANSSTGGSWTTSNAAIASVNSSTGLVTGVATGTATITYTIGTCFVTTSINVLSLPGATISALTDTIICPGTYAFLVSSTGTGYTYQWYNGAAPISGETNPYYNAYSNGNYRVSITNPSGCNSVSSPMSVTVSPATASITVTGSTTFCPGSGVILNANTGAGLIYQWLNGGAAISGATAASYTATTGGNYSVIVTNAAGCSATSSSVTVNVLTGIPGSVTIYGALNFCPGDSVVMVADTATGTSYQWQVGGVNIIGATNNTYTASTTGNYTVFETSSSGCTGSSATAAVNVLPLPNASITASGAITFCAGGNVTLSATAVGGNTYQWYDGGIAIVGAYSSNYIATTSGNYTVKVTSAGGCINTTTTAVVVTVLSSPAIVAYTSVNFCWGGSALLGIHGTAVTGVNYQWQVGGVNIPGATLSYYNANTTGNYLCVESLPAGACSVGSNIIPVVQLPLPNPVITWDGAHLNTGNYFTSYQWYKGYTMIPGANTWWIAPSDSGRYSVEVSDTDGCRSLSPQYVLHSLTRTGVATVTLGEIKIYPNPTENLLHIVASGKLRAVLTAVDGRVVLNQADATEIEMGNLPGGTYLLLLYDTDGSMVKAERIVKK